MFGKKTKDKKNQDTKKGNDGKEMKDKKAQEPSHRTESGAQETKEVSKPSEPKNKVKKLSPDEQKIAELSNNVLELTTTLQTVQAEFANFKKRTEAQNVENIKFASREMICKILPILDNFELALNSLGILNVDDSDKKPSVVFKDEKAAGFVKGIEMIYSQLFTMLENEGVKKIEAVGKKFDPYMHEALLKEDAKGVESDTVIEVLQKGYILNDKVLRHSKVKVAK